MSMRIEVIELKIKYDLFLHYNENTNPVHYPLNK